MRLIDADAFKEYCKNGLEEMKGLFKTTDGLELAIKTTESFLKDIDEQPTIEMAEDCVSREAVLEQAIDYGSKTFLIPVNSVKALPSVQPQPKNLSIGRVSVGCATCIHMKTDDYTKRPCDICCYNYFSKYESEVNADEMSI